MERDPRPSVKDLERMLRASTGIALRRLIESLEEDERAGVQSAVAVARSREAARRTEQTRIDALYSLQAELARDGYTLVAGIDEVGRGAIAGPLSAGACILPAIPRIEGLNDSKMLSPAARESIAERIREVAVCWSVAHVSAAELDAIGVTSALRQAMGNAIAGLAVKPDRVVIDGVALGLFPDEIAVVKGDAKVAPVSAASILAKVERDSLMVELSSAYPQFGFEVNKGYGTREHLTAVARFGPSELHRISFCPGGGTQTLF